jgi:hypothetical protein
VPVIFDGDTYQTESNAILLSLGKQTGWGLERDSGLQCSSDNVAVLSGIDTRALFRANRILGQINKNAQFSRVHPLQRYRKPRC